MLDLRIEEFSHQKNEEALSSSTLQGCHLCILLSWKLPSSGNIMKYLKTPVLKLQIKFGTHEDLYNRRRTIIQRGEMRIGTQNIIPNNTTYGPGLAIEFESAKSSDILSRVSDPAQYSISTGSDASFHLAKQWIKICLENHSICKKTYSSSSSLPTRLLDLGESASDGSSIRLWLTKDITSELFENLRPEYVALSHRWGQAQPLRLLKSNEAEFFCSIPLADVPLTFQHAVAITRRLRYRYLWIDSLCIIQDSTSDWIHESAIMGEIYCGSILTISALAALDSGGGCFVTRNPFLYTPCKLGKMEDGRGADILAVNLRIPTGPHGELLQRAWVLQERILSLRTLHYGHEGILWECSQFQANENAPEFLNWEYDDKNAGSDNGGNWGLALLEHDPKSSFVNLLSLPGDTPCDFSKPTDNNVLFYEAWIKLLNQYASCSLMMPDDKLVALNGIIGKIQKRTGLTSVAGLWRELLPINLLWYYPSDSTSIGSRPKEFRAPSWSWASIDCSGIHNPYAELSRGRDEKLASGRVSYDLGWRTKVLKIESVSKANGSVSAAHIRVRGPLGKVKWAENKGQSHLDVELDTVPSRSKQDKWYSDNKLPDLEEFWALLIVRGRGSALTVRLAGIKEAMIDIGLVLQRVDGHENTFKRVGYFEQCYWTLDTYPIFAGSKVEGVESITMV